MVLDNQGVVYSFGWNDFGQIGRQTSAQEDGARADGAKADGAKADGTTADGITAEDMAVEELRGNPCLKIAAGAISSIAITAKGRRVYAWGSQ